MSKLIDAFANDKSLTCALALVKYLDKHMMAECMATDEERSLIGQARYMKQWARQ